MKQRTEDARKNKNTPYNNINDENKKGNGNKDKRTKHNKLNKHKTKNNRRRHKQIN